MGHTTIFTKNLVFITISVLLLICCANGRYLMAPGFYGKTSSVNVMGKAADVFNHRGEGNHHQNSNNYYEHVECIEHCV